MTMEALVVDIACGAILLLFGIIGLVKGLARQLLGWFAWFMGLVIAFFISRPLYDLLCKAAFMTTWREGLESAGFIITIATNIKAGVPVFVNYIFFIPFYIILAILSGIVYSLLRKLCVHFCGTGGFRVIDKILGCLFGLVIGAVIVIILLSIVNYILANTVAPVSTFMSNAETSITMKYVWNIFMLDHFTPYVEFNPLVVYLANFIRNLINGTL